jgi:hypothetical protein
MGLRENYRGNEKGEQNFEVLPIGEYHCSLFEASARIRPFGDAETETEITWVVVDGTHRNRRIWQKIVNRESMAWMMRSIWDALGLSGQPWDGLPEDASDADIWAAFTQALYNSAGKRCRILISHNNWTSGHGEERTEPRVDKVSHIAASATENRQVSTGLTATPADRAPNEYGGGGYTAPQPGDKVPF